MIIDPKKRKGYKDDQEFLMSELACLKRIMEAKVRSIA
jgi:hypothetical protein